MCFTIFATAAVADAAGSIVASGAAVVAAGRAALVSGGVMMETVVEDADTDGVVLLADASRQVTSVVTATRRPAPSRKPNGERGLIVAGSIPAPVTAGGIVTIDALGGSPKVARVSSSASSA